MKHCFQSHVIPADWNPEPLHFLSCSEFFNSISVRAVYSCRNVRPPVLQFYTALNKGEMYMIAARLLSWQLCWEGGNGVSRCCKENETALVRPRFRSFAALCALSRQKPQLRKLQPYSHILTFTVLYFLKWYCDHFFSLLKSISLLILSFSFK